MDVNIPGKVSFLESEFCKVGEPQLSVFETEYGNIGIGICRDIRYPEYSEQLCKQFDCCLLVFPSNFAITIGEMQWDTLNKARAMDCQVFVAGCQPARNTEDLGLPQSHGHSRVTNPWGMFVAATETFHE